jgi:hypothetical protein
MLTSRALVTAFMTVRAADVPPKSMKIALTRFYCFDDMDHLVTEIELSDSSPMSIDKDAP